MSGLFEFRSPAQQKEDDARYAARIFPRGIQVQTDVAALLAQLCPKSRQKILMIAFVCGKEGIQKLRYMCSRDSLPAPTIERERAAALEVIAPRRLGLNRREVACALALIFADLAADNGEPMAELEQLREAAQAEEAAMQKL